MNLAAVGRLPLGPVAGTWTRAVAPHFMPTALHTAHTRRVFSRFSPGPLGTPPFEILYLAESRMVALFEVQALFGSPTHPGGVVPNPRGAWTAISVQARLSAAADLTQILAQSHLATSVQELTGDWRGYRLRGPGASVPLPIGIAPKQELGEALYRDSRGIEGFRTVSAKLPDRMVLAVFPQNLRAGSFVRYEYVDGAGARRMVEILPP